MLKKAEERYKMCIRDRCIYGKLTKSVSREFWRVKMLEVQELTKKYGKNVAVDHVSFMVQDGQVGICLLYTSRCV